MLRKAQARQATEAALEAGKRRSESGKERKGSGGSLEANWLLGTDKMSVNESPPTIEPLPAEDLGHAASSPWAPRERP